MPLVLIIATAPPAARAAQASAEAAPVTQRTEWARMRDGVLLPSEVYLPKDMSGPLPVILMRSPYNAGVPGPCDGPCRSLVTRGYAVVNQDVRGTGRAGGVAEPFLQEKNDGYDAVEWAAARPWSNGKIGLWGISYGGATVMQAAASQPPHLVAAVAIATASDYHDNWVYVNGVFDLWFAQSWLVRWANDDGFRRQLEASGLARDEVQERIKERESMATGKLRDWNAQVPLNEVSEFKTTAPFYYKWLAHPAYDEYWSAIDLERRYADITVPVLLIGGWYDIFSVGTVRTFLGLRSHGGSVPARDQSKLVMYPICHNVCNDSMMFTAELWNTAARMNPEWWDFWLKGVDTGVARDPAVKLFVMVPPEHGNHDDGFWIKGNEYPLPGTKRIRLRLGSHGRANTRNGDGTLDARGVATSAADHFVYDPHDPVPTLGGNLCCIDKMFKAGAFDQSELELRRDILVYTSARLTADAVVIGPVTLEFWAETSAPDTDFTAKIVDVRPDGFAHNILDRIVNARLRHGSKSAPSAIEPGRPYEYHIDLGDTAIVFKAGHRIRLEISSSNFPHFARNPNTGRPAATEKELRAAKQTILHDAAHPSYLELPVIEKFDARYGKAER